MKAFPGDYVSAVIPTGSTKTPACCMLSSACGVKLICFFELCRRCLGLACGSGSASPVVCSCAEQWVNTVLESLVPKQQARSQSEQKLIFWEVLFWLSISHKSWLTWWQENRRLNRIKKLQVLWFKQIGVLFHLPTPPLPAPRPHSRRPHNSSTKR